jgi:prephenate dehydratase
MEKKMVINEEDKEKLVSAYKILQELSEHEFPVVRFNCKKAKNELWQALFELDFLGGSDAPPGLGLFADR